MLSGGFVVPKKKKLNANSEVKKFFTAFSKCPQSSLYILCNLVLDVESKDSLQADKAIESIQKQISTEQLDVIVDIMLEIEEFKNRLLSKDRVKSFLLLKTSLMTQSGWLEPIGLDCICKLSKDDEFILMGLIALIRKYSSQNTQKAPFDGFDFSVLKNSGTKQIINSIRKIVQSCGVLPSEYFRRLGRDDINYARVILSFLQEHPSRFDMGEYFIICHPTLKSELYKNWKQTKESSALPKKEKQLLNETVSSVGHKHPKFQDILTTNRIPRDLPYQSYDEHDYGYIGNILGHVKDIEWGDVAVRSGAAVIIGIIECLEPNSIVPLPIVATITGLGHIGKWFIWAATTPEREVIGSAERTSSSSMRP